MERESLEFDVVVVGGGPAGLAAAIRLRQLCLDSGIELDVCVLEKGSEIGAHLVSGAIFDPRALDELLPDWRSQGAPVSVAVNEERVYWFTSARRAVRLPAPLVPRSLHSPGCFVVSLGALCRWLAEQAEALGVHLFPGFPAARFSYDENGTVGGVITGDRGLDRHGRPRAGFEPGLDLRARRTILAEGARGHLGRELRERFRLDSGRDPQHYALGFKELWAIDPDRHRPGLVIHGAGWPLGGAAGGGSFLYHGEDGRVAVGLAVDLGYRNPHLSPFDEFQRFKHHPLIGDHLAGGERIGYGARVIAKGGLHSLPRMEVPGAVLVGCDAGTLNPARLKGIHTAMKSGMLAAEAVHGALSGATGKRNPGGDYEDLFRRSWVREELLRSRNFTAAMHTLGRFGGAGFNLVDQNLLGGRAPIALRDRVPDHARLRVASRSRRLSYPAPDGVISFDRPSSVFLSGTDHKTGQPCHLQLHDAEVPVRINLDRFDAPEQRYCPAGVYEIVHGSGAPVLQINAQNCLHCKACDVKDPTGNIRWVPPEGGGGPSYIGM